MVGRQYDCLINPLGAVRSTFEKAVPTGADPTSFDGKDWGVSDLFREYLFSKRSRQSGDSRVYKFQNDDVLGFMIVPILTHSTNEGTWNSNKFTNISQFPMGHSQIFTVSQLHSIRVLFKQSLISVETGKAIAKTSRSLVQNGNCQWTENLSVYIWVPHDNASKRHGQSLHKLLIFYGSNRSGILGEVTVNLSSHLSSETSTTVAEPLKNCSYGTILQVSHY
ncbi:putative NT-type C2 domain-containing protein [Helianthus anomalus]